MISTSRPVYSTPARELDLRAAARHLVANPLVLSERDPDTFRLIRRYEHELDRWFTQRFGYRLEVAADTARSAQLLIQGARSRSASTRCCRSHWRPWPRVRA